jgi:hypothetical protein
VRCCCRGQEHGGGVEIGGGICLPTGDPWQGRGHSGRSGHEADHLPHHNLLSPNERIWYNSCRHRLCPQCAWVQVERWLTKQKARLLVCEHYHVIFTLPHELNDLWLANIEGMGQLLFSSVHHALLELLGDSK